jgi:hypothetical protein
MFFSSGAFQASQTAASRKPEAASAEAAVRTWLQAVQRG